jgi:hypothetical protein
MVATFGSVFIQELVSDRKRARKMSNVKTRPFEAGAIPPGLDGGSDHERTCDRRSWQNEADAQNQVPLIPLRFEDNQDHEDDLVAYFDASSVERFAVLCSLCLCGEILRAVRQSYERANAAAFAISFGPGRTPV